MKMRKGNRGMGILGGLTRGNLLLALVTLIPVGLIAYSLGASLIAPDTDMELIVSALLIMGVGGFVIWDALSPSRSVDSTPRARIERRARPFPRWSAGK